MRLKIEEEFADYDDDDEESFSNSDEDSALGDTSHMSVSHGGPGGGVSPHTPHTPHTPQSHRMFDPGSPNLAAARAKSISTPEGLQVSPSFILKGYMFT